MQFILTENSIWILSILKQHHKEAFLVGGCVRDMLMKRIPHDIDITTSALPEEVIDIFSKENCKVIPTGLQHGTITLLRHHEAIEVTTYRIDSDYINHRRPKEVAFSRSLIEDLKRRDFTMNAIAYHPELGLQDPFNGVQDIKEHVIRCVGDANKRMQEDALRILRALRFEAVLNFSLTQACQQAIMNNAHLLAYISKERIRDEFSKLLMGERENTLERLHATHTLSYILPDYEKIYGWEQKTPWHKYDIFTHTDIALNHTYSYPLESKLAIIFHDIGKIEVESFDEQGIAHYKKHALISTSLARTYLKDLKFDNHTIDKVCKLILYHDYYLQENKSMLRKFLTKFDNNIDFAFQALDIQIADDYAKNMEKSQEKIDTIIKCKQMMIEMEKEHDLFTLKDLAINGLDIQAIGLKGKEIGDALTYALDLVLLDPSVNTKDYLLKTIQIKFKKSL
ncbi:MAG: HD domain-containing protein [Longicatena sp.]